MCGRFSQGESHRDLAAIFGAELEDDLPDGKWNVAPTDPIRMVVEHDGARRLTSAAWGFRPFWHQPESTGQRTPRSGWINAKAETAFDSPAFGPALRTRRCIIPADAFYEWDRAHRPPQPYAIGPASADGVLALAGIWTDADRGATRTAAILTTGSNELMAPLHHRMPVILAPSDLDAWLAPDAPLPAIASLLAPAPEASLRVWPVGTAVNSVRNDGPHLLEPMGVAPTLWG